MGGKRAKGTTVRCRLDRVVVNKNWHDKFAHSVVKYMSLWGLDHCPILADILAKLISLNLTNDGWIMRN